MESIAVFEDKIYICPRDFSKKISIDNVILEKLANKLEGKCSLHGWVKPQSVKVISRSSGYIENGRFTGDTVFHVQSEATVINTPSGLVVRGDVIKKNKMGMFVNYKDAVRIILPRDLHIGNEEYDNTEVGDFIKVEIKKSQFQVNDLNILSVGLFRGTDKNIQMNEEKEEKEIETIVENKNMPVVEEEEEKKEEEELKPILVQEEEKAIEQEQTNDEEESENTNPIYFASKHELFNEFSNFHKSPITLDGKLWATVEHYFQAMKFPSDPTYQEKIRLEKTPVKAKALGQSRTVPIRVDWDAVREDIMKKALEAKFTQNDTLKSVLLSTGDRPIIEDTIDSYWGRGKNNKGQNRLGALLMELRTKLKTDKNIK